ncbi:DUF3427 domain-containing protein [Nakamurella sp.]|uniref:DUF3427 domain-containing protein n=1 Tax=Nakamurella sp. TaxID=1869182 RepID=UPI0037846419
MTTRLRARLDGRPHLVPEIAAIHSADQPAVLARHVHDAVQRTLANEPSSDRRIELVNRVLTDLGAVDDRTEGGPRQLWSLAGPAGPGRVAGTMHRPRTPLSDAALLTNARGEPSLGAELRAELTTADQVDLLCAFVKWHGLRLLEAEFRDLRQRGIPLRVVTTTYVGATERAALDRLVDVFGAQVKIQFDALRTRLHAKAWLFRRRTGFDTAYVGSSNLSRSALLDGAEWNVRLSRVATPVLLDKFSATFDSYWNEASFETYEPHRDRGRLDDALAAASGRQSTTATIALSGLEVRPYSYQATMLDALMAERQVHDRHRNLLVAATGTGKTVVAALDYQRLCPASGVDRPSLLFVAHRKEILEQSRRVYQEVLRDQTFGELYVGGARPERWRHVFASVQSLHAYGISRIPQDAFEIAVIDEFHHAEASTYRAILDHLRPVELLGLTATPERADGMDVRSFFGGRTASELRLWDALSADLLCPFHYFGISDGTDLRSIQWSRGRYDQDALSNVFTGNDARARLILLQIRDKIAEPARMRALGFCVSRAHAEYMASTFNRAGIPAACVTSETGAQERAAAVRNLGDCAINAVFTVDVFNEGVDLPNVDTVLFLRPTESATVFLQQLGRGLRRARDKPVLTVLDFVGQHRKEFRFDVRYRALVGGNRRELERQVENGFPFLPSGCQIVLDEVVQGLVLANIRGQLTIRWASLVAECRASGDVELSDFLDETGVELADLIRSDRSWSRLRREAGLATPEGGPAEAELLRRVRSVSHVDDPDRAHAYLSLLADDAPAYNDLSPVERGFARMLLYSLWPTGNFASFDAVLRTLRQEASARSDLRAVIDLSFDSTRHLSVIPHSELSASGLRVHARYQREEILSALGLAARLKPAYFQAGVARSDELNLDAFLITLRKNDTDYSPTTMYRDYAISSTLFHWESQSATSVDSPTGQRYIDHRRAGSSILLFVRERKESALGPVPYTFLGTAQYVSHRGDRPIEFIWKLDVPMPMDLFTAASVTPG